MRVLAVLLLLVLATAVRAQHQLGDGDFGSHLLIALRQMLARVVCGWAARCAAHATNTCLRERQEASQLVVTLTQCYTFVPDLLHVNPRTDGRVMAVIVQQLKQCLRERNDKADVFLECVARG